MNYEWIIARHRSNSDQAKYILSLVNSGIGYHLINRDRAKNEDVVVAFKRPLSDEPLPIHLARANATQIHKLDQMDIKRRGNH